MVPYCPCKNWGLKKFKGHWDLNTAKYDSESQKITNVITDTFGNPFSINGQEPVEDLTPDLLVKIAIGFVALSARPIGQETMIDFVAGVKDHCLVPLSG